MVALLVLFLAIASWAYWFIATRDAREFSRVTYKEHCANCHGFDLRGGSDGPSLLQPQLRHGDSVSSLTRSIREAVPEHAALDIPENRVHSFPTRRSSDLDRKSVV